MSKQEWCFTGVCVCQRNVPSTSPTTSTNCFHYGKRKTQCRRFIMLINKQRKCNLLAKFSRLPGDGVIVLIMQTMSACPFLAGRH
ncbi:uncharacterized protein LOC108037056 [Drosophila rhopaloa]|uniref:Uncharacterized protein n=1 Tax=Drosophila rhopaloa TaxID=1041015 RepID=A0ABM5J292_DRORH|nr:uncharacterized protein LOC108037056 [Drosophila rhopaloa]